MKKIKITNQKQNKENLNFSKQNKIKKIGYFQKNSKVEEQLFPFKNTFSLKIVSCVYWQYCCTHLI